MLGEKYVYEESDQIPETVLGIKEVSEIPSEYYTTGISGTAYRYSLLDGSGIEVTPEIINVLLKNVYDSKEYWIASLGIYALSWMMYSGPGFVGDFDSVSSYSALFYNDGVGRGCGYGVKPVISLKSTVTVDQLEKITGIEDEPWPEYGDVSIDSGGGIPR